MKKGFTLIELLVVVAIIGLLATVVLASLNSARNKSKDAAIKQSLAQFKRQAEVYYLDNGNYDNICEPTTQSGIIFRDAVSRAMAFISGQPHVCFQGSGHYYDSGSTITKATNSPAVDSNGSSWAVAVRLNNGNYLCIDSLGKTVEAANWGVAAGSPGDKTCG